MPQQFPKVYFNSLLATLLIAKTWTVWSFIPKNCSNHRSGKPASQSQVCSQ